MKKLLAVGAAAIVAVASVAMPVDAAYSPRNIRIVGGGTGSYYAAVGYDRGTFNGLSRVRAVHRCSNGTYVYGPWRNVNYTTLSSSAACPLGAWVTSPGWQTD